MADKKANPGDSSSRQQEQAAADKQAQTLDQIEDICAKPLNEKGALQAIEDYKYLLEANENRCAFAYFAILHRNQSLYDSLQRYFEKFYSRETKAQGGPDVKAVTS